MNQGIESWIPAFTGMTGDSRGKIFNLDKLLNLINFAGHTRKICQD